MRCSSTTGAWISSKTLRLWSIDCYFFASHTRDSAKTVTSKIMNFEPPHPLSSLIIFYVDPLSLPVPINKNWQTGHMYRIYHVFLHDVKKSNKIMERSGNKFIKIWCESHKCIVPHPWFVICIIDSWFHRLRKKLSQNSLRFFVLGKSWFSAFDVYVFGLNGDLWVMDFAFDLS